MSPTTNECLKHGVYVVPHCPGCLYEQRFPEAAAFMDALVRQRPPTEKAGK